VEGIPVGEIDGKGSPNPAPQQESGRDDDPSARQAPKTSAKAWAILAAMGFGALIAQMFSNAMGPALPTITSDLSLSLSATTWIVTSYSLAFGAALVAGGRMGDLVGEVRMIVIGFVIFGAGLLMSAVAANGGVLIAGRTVQGIGIGLSAPATLSIVVNSFPALRRGFAVGVWGFAHGFGILIGPIVAGYLTESVGWRWVFWVAIPLTVAVILVTLASTRGYQSVLASGTYDWIGMIVGGSAITAVTFGLQNASFGWTQPATLVPLVGGLVLFAAFAVIEVKVEHPLVDFDLWRERLFSGGFFAESAVGFVYIPMLTFVGSLYFINILGFSPVKASWVIVLTTGTCMVLEPLAGRWVDKIGPGIPITSALVMQAVALFWMGTFTPDTTLTQMIIPLMLMGAGVGIALPACNTAGMSAVDAERAGMGSGLMQMTFNIPAALGAAVVTSIIGTVTVGQVTKAAADYPAYTQQAVDYAEATERGEIEAAEAALAGLPQDIQAAIQEYVIQAQSSAIALSMIALGVAVLAGAVFAWVVIGRRRTPDHLVMTRAAEV
jgi:EmrB/QacA subfamily drug resistance transporter